MTERTNEERDRAIAKLSLLLKRIYDSGVGGVDGSLLTAERELLAAIYRQFSPATQEPQ